MTMTVTTTSATSEVKSKSRSAAISQDSSALSFIRLELSLLLTCQKGHSKLRLWDFRSSGRFLKNCAKACREKSSMVCVLSRGAIFWEVRPVEFHARTSQARNKLHTAILQANSSQSDVLRVEFPRELGGFRPFEVRS